MHFSFAPMLVHYNRLTSRDVNIVFRDAASVDTTINDNVTKRNCNKPTTLPYVGCVCLRLFEQTKKLTKHKHHLVDC